VNGYRLLRKIGEGGSSEVYLAARGDSAAAVMRQQLAEPPPRLPLGLMRFQGVLDRLLTKDAAARYRSAAELIGELQEKFGDLLAAAAPSFLRDAQERSSRAAVGYQ
jgi:hypothetical protein